MKLPFMKSLTAAAVVAGLAAYGIAASAAVAETPQRGGILSFMVASEVPSYDLHRETTFGVIHPIAPFYSLLVRINPEDPSASTDFVCDLCVGKVAEPTDGGKTYTFKIRTDVKFHDGTPLTAQDVKATFDKIVFPPQGVASARRAQMTMVEAVEAPDNETVTSG